MSNKKITFFFLLPIIISFSLHAPILNLDLIGYHVWRQTQTQTVIYNFTFSDNSIFNPQKFDLTNGSTTLLYEFPLYQWIIAQVNNCFGYSVLHTRLFTFLIFVFFLLGFYRLVKKLVEVEVALISNVLICFSPLLYYYCVNPLPDILSLCFSIWALNFFFCFIIEKKIIYFLIFAVFIMLAALVKLPYIIFCAVFLLHAFKRSIKKERKELLAEIIMLLFCLTPVFLWYSKAIPTWVGNGITSGLIKNNKPLLVLLDYFQFNLISSVPELLTNYASCVFLVTGIYLFFKRIKNLKNHHHYLIILFLFLSFYFLFELNMIEKTHDYYLMPFIPLIFLVVTYGVNYVYYSRFKKYIFFIVCIVPLTAWLRINTRWNLEKPGFTKDYLTQKNYFQKIISTNDTCIIDYDESRFMSLYYLKRKGYSLLEDQLNQKTLKELYLKGAKFLVSENPTFNTNDYPNFNFKNIYDKNLKIFRLELK